MSSTRTSCLLKTIIFIIATTESYAQDIHMPSVQEMNMWYNPALKTTKHPQTYASFRNVNYKGIVGYTSRVIGIEIPILPGDKEITDITPYTNITAGISATSSGDRSMASSAAMLGLTYTIPLNDDDTYLSAGFNVSYNFNRIGPSIFGGYYPDGFDKQDAFGAAIVADPFLSGYNFGYFIGSAGTAIFHNGENSQWYAGVSTRNFNHPYTEWNRNSRLAANNGIQAAYTTAINANAAIGGNANLSWHNGIHEHFFGATYTRNFDDSANYKITGGIGYRPADAIIPNIILTLRRSRVSFFYDINLPNTLYKFYRRKAYTFSYRLIL